MSNPLPSMNPDPCAPALVRCAHTWREAQIDLQEALDQHVFLESSAQVEEKIRRIKRAYVRLENAYEDLKQEYVQTRALPDVFHGLKRRFRQLCLETDSEL